jgi:hypothetical protein
VIGDGPDSSFHPCAAKGCHACIALHILPALCGRLFFGFRIFRSLKSAGAIVDAWVEVLTRGRQKKRLECGRLVHWQQGAWAPPRGKYKYQIEGLAHLLYWRKTRRTWIETLFVALETQTFLRFAGRPQRGKALSLASQWKWTSGLC